MWNEYRQLNSLIYQKTDLLQNVTTNAEVQARPEGLYNGTNIQSIS